MPVQLQHLSQPPHQWLRDQLVMRFSPATLTAGEDAEVQRGIYVVIPGCLSPSVWETLISLVDSSCVLLLFKPYCVSVLIALCTFSALCYIHYMDKSIGTYPFIFEFGCLLQSH